jgi:hypothetical protein
MISKFISHIIAMVILGASISLASPVILCVDTTNNPGVVNVGDLTFSNIVTRSSIMAAGGSGLAGLGVVQPAVLGWYASTNSSFPEWRMYYDVDGLHIAYVGGSPPESRQATFSIGMAQFYGSITAAVYYGSSSSMSGCPLGALSEEHDTNALAQLSIETNRAQLAEALLLPKSGGTMTGPLDMGNFSINGTAISSPSNGVIRIGRVNIGTNILSGFDSLAFLGGAAIDQATWTSTVAKADAAAPTNTAQFATAAQGSNADGAWSSGYYYTRLWLQRLPSTAGEITWVTNTTYFGDIGVGNVTWDGTQWVATDGETTGVSPTLIGDYSEGFMVSGVSSSRWDGSWGWTLPLVTSKLSTNDPAYENAITNISVSGPASISRSGRDISIVVSNQVKAWYDPTVLTSAPTVTVSYASGPYQSLLLTNNCYLTLSTQSMPRTGRSEIELGINISSYSLTIDTTYYDTNDLTTALAANYWYTLHALKGPNQSRWRLKQVGSPFQTQTSFVNASGGLITTYSSGGMTYRVHSFSNSVGTTNFSVTTGGAIDALIIAGGGGGAHGGGGAGGYLYTQNLTVVSGSNYILSIGGGGFGGQANNGGGSGGGTGTNTTAFGFTRNGGGAGAREDANGGNGGCGGGGGGAVNSTGGTGSQGFAGGNGSGTLDYMYQPGGGGGAGFAGEAGSTLHAGLRSGGWGGTGVVVNITGSSMYYCDGGGGGTDTSGGRSQANTTGGSGTGGSGMMFANGTAGKDGHGSGGGGADIRSGPYYGGKGGNGAVYIRYRIE